MILLRFSRGSGAAAALVRWATWSWCAHVGFKLPTGQVLDATPEFGVSLRWADDDPGTRYYQVEALPMAIEHARSQCGAPYDWRGALGIGFHRDWRTQGSWFCSELVAWACERAGVPLLRVDHLDRITPRDLLLSPLLEPTGRRGASPTRKAAFERPSF